MPKVPKSSFTKSKAPAAVAPDLAESTPSLPTKTKKVRSKKVTLPIGGDSVTKTKKTSKRSAPEVTADEEASPTLKKTKINVSIFPTSISAGGQKPVKGRSEKPIHGSDDVEQADEVHLRGFSSGSDSSDEDDDDGGVDSSPIDVGALPTIAKDDATVKRKLDAAKKQPVCDCVSYVYVH